MKNSISNFLDAEGRVTQWPAKHFNKQLVLEYLVMKFSMGKFYTEQEVNAILKKWHTFGDWAILRRSLVDYKFMERKIDGTEYRRLH